MSWLPGEALGGGKTRKEALDFLKKTSQECAVKSVGSALKSDLDRETLETVLSFYDSKLGRKVGRLQSAALAPRLMDTIREGRKFAVSQSERRLELIGRLIRAEGISAASAGLAKSAVRGIFDGASGRREIPGEQIKPATRSAQPKSASGSEVTDEAALIAFSHTYSALDYKELEELLGFSESEAATRFRNSARRGLNEAVYATARALGVALSREPGRER